MSGFGGAIGGGVGARSRANTGTVGAGRAETLGRKRAFSTSKLVDSKVDTSPPKSSVSGWGIHKQKLTDAEFTANLSSEEKANQAGFDTSLEEKQSLNYRDFYEVLPGRRTQLVGFAKSRMSEDDYWNFRENLIEEYEKATGRKSHS